MLKAAGRSERVGDGGRTSYGPAVWIWPPLFAVALWAGGFFFLPWWAVLLVWWWPSVLIAALTGLLALALAHRLRGRRGAPSPPHSGGEP